MTISMQNILDELACGKKFKSLLPIFRGKTTRTSEILHIIFIVSIAYLRAS